MCIPTSSGKRAFWLCLYTVFQLASVFLNTQAAPHQLDADQGTPASAVTLARAKPSQTQLVLSWLWSTCGVLGAHKRHWGLKNVRLGKS